MHVAFCMFTNSVTHSLIPSKFTCLRLFPQHCSTGAVIGFTMTSYTQSESAGRIVVMVRVTSGDLGKNFSVLLDTSNHGGIGNILGEATWLMSA